MSSAETAAPMREPIVIYRSVNGNGETFAVEPQSLVRLREAFGAAVTAHPRIFIAHETLADLEHVRTQIAPQVVQLLTGVSIDRLEPLRGVMFQDPVTEKELPQTEE